MEEKTNRRIGGTMQRSYQKIKGNITSTKQGQAAIKVEHVKKNSMNFRNVIIKVGRQSKKHLF